MIAPLLEQLTEHAEIAAGSVKASSPTYWQGFHDGQAAAFTDAALLVSTWAAWVQS
jgi:hypothetical protein